MKLLDDALAKIRPYIIERISDEKTKAKNVRHYRSDVDPYDGVDRPGTARLRLDWELSAPEFNRLEREQVADIMIDYIKADLEDLIVNGDINLYGDPLLKVINGSKKRGVEPTGIEIRNAALYWNFNGRRSTCEYTLYILMQVDWPGHDTL